jgi:hypothetical protein
MLTIHHPEVIERENETILQARIESKELDEVLWFSTSSEYGRFLCHERGDAFLVALFLYAMRRGMDITVEAPVSERLYYMLTKHLMPTITTIFPHCHLVKVHCPLDEGHLDSAGAVGVGFSCGVDSMYTISKHTKEDCPRSRKLTHLAFFNVGASGDFGGDVARDLFRRGAEAVRPCAEELGLPMVTLDSNLSEILMMNYVATYVYRNAAAVLALQKLFNVYYFSSGYSLRQFELSPADSGHYDFYSLSMLSTNDTELVMSGETLSRLEKTDVVSEYPLSYRHLCVCVRAERNCSRCFKCQRTMVTLDVLGKLDRYGAVFDLDHYQAHRSRYIGSVISDRKADSYKQDIYEEMVRRNFALPTAARIFRYPLAAAHTAHRRTPHTLKNAYWKVFRVGMACSPHFVKVRYRRMKRL